MESNRSGNVVLRVDLARALAEATDAARASEDRERLSGSLRDFIPEAFPHVKPGRPYKHNWHIDAVCAHLQAVSDGHIERLQIWQPPGTMKSYAAHVMWPVWEWTRNPHLRYWCASHSLGLVWQHCGDSRTLIESE